MYYLILVAIKLQQSHLEQAIETENIFHFAWQLNTPI